MKKFFVTVLFAAIACVTCGCSDAPVQSRFTENYAEVWFDNYMKSYDELQSIEMDEFPNVIFRSDGLNVTAEKNGKETVMFNGNPVDAVYLSDLTGDGLPEFCTMVCIGFGFIDERIIVYDYASKTSYGLSDRFNYDYFLTMEDGSLIVNQVSEDKTVSGKLALRDGELVME